MATITMYYRIIISKDEHYYSEIFKSETRQDLRSRIEYLTKTHQGRVEIQEETCYGCISGALGQRDHMEFGGCLYDENY